jgi:hypothetical protein
MRPAEDDQLLSHAGTVAEPNLTDAATGNVPADSNEKKAATSSAHCSQPRVCGYKERRFQ